MLFIKANSRGRPSTSMTSLLDFTKQVPAHRLPLTPTVIITHNLQQN